jgi:CubicO group peptidase (beta-lactamase class C family)
MDSSFHALAEAAAARWRVPALELGSLVDGEQTTLAVGCRPGTRFRVASITKPFTATLALRLLDLDAPTGVWPGDVLVRHLLSHTSGYESEHGDLARFGDGDDALGAVVDELPSLRRLVGVGEAWSYANSGYWLAGWLAARAAETTYEEALARHVLEPAGLEATAFDVPELEGSGRSALPDPYPRARRPSGGLVSTVTDLLSFARWHLADADAAVMREPAAATVSGVYGLGLFGEQVGGTDVWGHPGSYGGFQSMLLIVPDRGAAFVGLTNSGLGAQALRELEDAWFESVLGARRPVPDPVELSAAALSALAGTYANPELTVTFAPAPGGLTAEAVEDGERFSFAARPIGPRTFEIVGGDDDGYRFDFPLEGFVRAGSRLAERVSGPGR